MSIRQSRFRTPARPSAARSRMLLTHSIASSLAFLMIGGCATAPRGPAASLASAGLTSTGAMARDYRTTASRLREIAVLDAFSNTLAICSNPQLECVSQLPPDRNRQIREELARSIELRGRAVEALSASYAALKTEADYDARADLVTATNTAVDAINSFSNAILGVTGAAAAPAAGLIREPLKRIVGLGTGRLAERAQAKRLKHASMAIRQAAQHLRNALSVEAFVFNDLATYLVETRVSARKSMLQSGLASHQSVVTPMIDSLELKPADGMEATIRKSPATQAAVVAIVEARARDEIAQTQARYAAALRALDELIKAHADFERDAPLSLAELERFLSELNAAVKPAN